MHKSVKVTFYRPKRNKSWWRWQREKCTPSSENLLSHPRLGWNIIPSAIVIVVSKGQVQDLLCCSTLCTPQFKMKEEAYYGGLKGEKGVWGITLMQPIYVGWIWEFFTKREEEVMADTAMRPCTLGRQQESCSERHPLFCLLGDILFGVN